ncbi:MAG: glycosyltransferase family 2 protein [Methanoregula sp.]|nr:glycosyltransferase family 2 protein [Methanoregula sp.]
MDSTLSIIIPAYNEEDNIDPVYRDLSSVLIGLGIPYEILLIDDGSTDQTCQKMKSLQLRDNSIRIIKFRKNFGQSAALQAGFDYATGTIIVTMDSDLQNDPRDIPALIEKIEREDFDVVCGWRYNRQDPVFKKIFSKMANSLRKFLTKETIHDSGCTLRSYRRECIEDLELYGELHRYIPAMLQWKGYRVGEIKVNHRERTHGSSKYSWKRLTKGFLDLIVIAFWQKYSVRPMHIFGGFGFILATIGFFISLYLIFERLFLNMGLTERPLFLVGFFMLVVGIQFIALGILADILLKIYYGQKERKPYRVDKILK